MKRSASPCKPPQSGRYSYTKVLDTRKHPIRGLWRRNGKFLALITVEAANGRKGISWVSLGAKTTAGARDEFRKVLVERSENCLRQITRAPTVADYLEKHLPPDAAR